MATWFFVIYVGCLEPQLEPETESFTPTITHERASSKNTSPKQKQVQEIANSQNHKRPTNAVEEPLDLGQLEEPKARKLDKDMARQLKAKTTKLRTKSLNERIQTKVSQREKIKKEPSVSIVKIKQQKNTDRQVGYETVKPLKIGTPALFELSPLYCRTISQKSRRHPQTSVWQFWQPNSVASAALNSNNKTDNTMVINSLKISSY